ncbi:hypothetical protein Acr_00g0037420 [Actinidia rufa]|uniref:Uncharacterized protein n=1 Tax=Actinidia rufa TaxID=165716 RepID=A0A7J0DI11_9ERIC|nr:hypothetical protein Acr_00g0037420 [Actinidia rufa]
MHGEDPIRDEFPMEGEVPMHGAYPSQEETSTQGEPPTWFLEYFGKLNESLGEIKQRQEEIIQNQVRKEQYIDRLGDIHHELRQQIDRRGDFYEEQGQRVDRLGNLYENMHEQHTHQLAEIDAQLEGLWIHLIPPPSFDLANAPPLPLFYRDPPY